MKVNGNMLDQNFFFLILKVSVDLQKLPSAASGKSNISRLKGLPWIRKTWLPSYRSGAAPVHWLCLVLRLSTIEVNGADPQYRIQPVDMCGAVFLILDKFGKPILTC